MLFCVKVNIIHQSEAVHCTMLPTLPSWAIKNVLLAISSCYMNVKFLKMQIVKEVDTKCQCLTWSDIINAWIISDQLVSQTIFGAIHLVY